MNGWFGCQIYPMELTDPRLKVTSEVQLGKTTVDGNNGSSEKFVG